MAAVPAGLADGHARRPQPDLHGAGRHRCRSRDPGVQPDGWTGAGAPQDAGGVEGDDVNDWVRRGGFGIKEGAAITTPDTVYLGFGFEGISGSAARNEVMDRIVDYLLR